MWNPIERQFSFNCEAEMVIHISPVFFLLKRSRKVGSEQVQWWVCAFELERESVWHTIHNSADAAESVWCRKTAALFRRCSYGIDMDEFWPALIRLHSADWSEMDWLRAVECSGLFYRERLALWDKFNLKVSFVYSREQIVRFSPQTTF